MSREEEIRGPAPEENGRTAENPRFSGRQHIFFFLLRPMGRAGEKAACLQGRRQEMPRISKPGRAEKCPPESSSGGQYSV